MNGGSSDIETALNALNSIKTDSFVYSRILLMYLLMIIRVMMKS